MATSETVILGMNVFVLVLLVTETPKRYETLNGRIESLFCWCFPNPLCRAGAESDVFVTPNLNVKYEVVDIIEWNHTKCEPIRNEATNEFPSNIAFDVKAPENKPALSFYSRYHIKTVEDSRTSGFDCFANRNN